MPPAATGDLTTFTARELIGSTGAGANGEKLANSLDTAYPPELRAAQQRRVNRKLTDKLTDSDWKAAAKLAGVPSLAGLKVRGGDLNPSDALVVYSWLDEVGQVWRGCFPYDDVGSSSSDDHFAMRDAIAASPAARDWAEAQEKAGAEPAKAEERPVDPIADYDDMSAEDVVAYMGDYPARKDVVKALETATRGDKARKTIMEWEPPKTDGSGSGDGAGAGASGSGGDAPPAT